MTEWVKEPPRMDAAAYVKLNETFGYPVAAPDSNGARRRSFFVRFGRCDPIDRLDSPARFTGEEYVLARWIMLVRKLRRAVAR